MKVWYNLGAEMKAILVVWVLAMATFLISGCVRPVSVPLRMAPKAEPIDEISLKVARCGDAGMGARIWEEHGEQRVDCVPMGFR